MRKISSLSEIRSDFISGKYDRKILEGLMFQYLIDNFDRYRLFMGDREKWGEFVSWLYPRLSRAVDYYKEKGTNFDTYIGSIVQWSCKEYKAREAEHKTTELACWKARANELDVCSPEEKYLDDMEPRNKPLFNFNNFSDRQILILFLKSYYHVSEEFLDKVAETIGMEKEELRGMVDQLHNIRSKKEFRIHTHQERIYSQYYRCIAFQKRMMTAQPGSARFEKMKEYTDRAQKRFSAMKERFTRMRTDATNRQISLILHIPKGTVDSALYSVREKLKTTDRYNTVRVPLEGIREEGYHGECSATATASMQAIPQMS